MTSSNGDIMGKTGFVDERHLARLVEGDRAMGEQEAGAGSPAIITATTAIGGLITMSGLCPTFSCTGEC